jgi:hypothetical protein
MADKELIIKYRAWKAGPRNCGAKLTECTSINRKGTMMEAELIYLFLIEISPGKRQAML